MMNNKKTEEKNGRKKAKEQKPHGVLVCSIPVGCRACGGPYPLCTDSCPLFDD